MLRMLKNSYKSIIIDKALRKNAKISLPEINDNRILEASTELINLGFNVVDLGNLKKNKVIYKKKLLKRKFSSNWTSSMLDKFMDCSINYSMLALCNNDVDCIVAGAVNSTSNILKSAIRLVGLKKTSKWVSSAFLMISPCDKYFYTYSDCAVIPEPSSEQLCSIAFEASKIHNLISGDLAKVAFLSFSTNGSAEHYKVKKIQESTRLFSKKYPSIIHEGEIQFDAAINKIVSNKKNINSTLKGCANVFIFPDLDSGNISYKITQYLGGYQAIGPILIGLEKPVNDLSRGCTVEDIVYTVAISALQT